MWYFKSEKVIIMLFDIKNHCKISIGEKKYATQVMLTTEGDIEIPFVKYEIKETDFRTKTASFVTDYPIDMTDGTRNVWIRSIYHENFAGLIIKHEFDENTGLHTYQCQDNSRNYMGTNYAFLVNCLVMNAIRSYVSVGKIPATRGPTSAERKKHSKILSGLKNVNLYDQALYKGNLTNVNYFKQRKNLAIKNESMMDTIRNLTIGSTRYIDLWFNERGVLHIDPLSRTDWLNTGLVLSANTDRKFVFDTTNAITNIIVNGDVNLSSQLYSGSDLLGLDLSAFFGNLSTSIDSHTTTVNSTLNSSNTTKNSSSKKKNNNPFNNKKKKVWINSDNGSNTMKNALAKALKKDGWIVHIGATNSNAHVRDYFNVTKDYSVYITLYNGFCAGTIREAYSDKIQNVLKKKGVQLVPIWDTSLWTNPNGMKPYRYGDFSKYTAKRAWDDNFSKNDPSIKNVGDYFKKNKATYCAGPSVSEIMKQFREGGYFKYVESKNKKSETTKKNTKTSSSVTVTFNDKMLNQTEAKNKIFEHSRDYFSCDITLPLGDTVLKNVHTNQFLFTELPPEFDLLNWIPIANSLSSSFNRYTGADYVINRWYIEGVTINVDASNNTGKMSLNLNAFASSTTEYSDKLRTFETDFKDAIEKNNKNNTTTSATKKTTTATKNKTLKGGQGKTIDNLVKKIVGTETNDLKKAKLIHEWLRKNVIYKYYECAKYFTPEKCYKHRSKLNCADTATLTCSLMLSAGLKAYTVHRTYNGGHFWCIIEIAGKKYASDQTGREKEYMSGSKFNTVWKRSGRTTVSNGGDYSRKCGAVAKCVGQ